MPILKDTTTLPGVTILTDSDAAGIVIDYTPFYERITTALESISTALGGDSSTLSSIVSGIESNLSAMSTNIGTMTTNSTAIKNLASGTGIHMVGPYDWLGYMSMYKLYVEDTGAIGLTKLTEYKDKISSLPTLF